MAGSQTLFHLSNECLFLFIVGTITPKAVQKNE